MKYFKGNLFIFTLWFLITYFGNHKTNCEVNPANSNFPLLKIFQSQSKISKDVDSKGSLEFARTKGRIWQTAFTSFGSHNNSTTSQFLRRKRQAVVRALRPLRPSLKGPGFLAGVKASSTSGAFSQSSLLKIPTKPLAVPSAKVSIPPTSPKLLSQLSSIQTPMRPTTGAWNLLSTRPPKLSPPPSILPPPPYSSAVKPPSILPPLYSQAVKPPSILPPLYSQVVKPLSILPPPYSPAAKPPSILPPPYSPAVKSPSILPPPYSPAVKPPSILPPPYSPAAKPPSIFPPPYSPAVKPPSILPPPYSPAVKPPSILPPPYYPAPAFIPPPYSPPVKPPQFLPPIYTTTAPYFSKPSITPIKPIMPFQPFSPSVIQPKPIQMPHVGPNSKGTYLAGSVAVAAAGATVLLHMPKPHISSTSNHGASPQDPPTDVRNPPICTLQPRIENGDLAHCIGTEAGHRCSMRCQRNYEPNVNSIQCVEKSPSQAEWELNGARCDYNVDPVCRDNFNRKVDWFVAYRVPKSFNQRTDSHLFISNLNPGQMDFQSDAEFNLFRNGNSWTDWIFDQGLLGATSHGKNPVGQTLSILSLINGGGTAGGGPSLKHILYSDQPPNGYALHSNGHSKGVLVHNSQGRGFYMVHSQPKFPNLPGTSFTHSLAKGQLFVCVTLSSQPNIDSAVRHVTNLHPKIYSGSSEYIFGRRHDVDLGLPIPTGLNEISLTSGGGKSFKLFSKRSKSGDIYRLIADTYGSDIFVQTWRNGRGTKLPSSCPVGGNRVQNVELMKFSSDTEDTTGWSTFGNWVATTDHAKWLVGQDEYDNLFCAGDMNRMESQEARWGGAICLSDLRVARAFRQLIEDIEPCPVIE